MSGQPNHEKSLIDLNAAIDPRADDDSTPDIDLLDADGKKKSQATLLIEIGQLHSHHPRPFQTVTESAEAVMKKKHLEAAKVLEVLIVLKMLGLEK